MGLILGMSPHLAAIVAEIIAINSEIDLQQGRYLASLLGTDQVAGVAMFLAITGDMTRRDVVAAASRTKRTIEEYALYERAFKKLRAVEAERNAFAHQLWGISDELPDALLLVDLEYRLSHMMEIDEMMKEWRKRIRSGRIEVTRIRPPPAAAMRLDPSKIGVYREADLKRSRKHCPRPDYASVYPPLCWVPGHASRRSTRSIASFVI